jgi:hypothetical protein
LGVFCLAHSISDLSPLPSLLGAHRFHIGNKGGTGPGFGQYTGGGGDGDGNSLRGRWRAGGIESSLRGSLPPGGADVPPALGRRWWRQRQGGRGGKNDHGVAHNDVADVAAGGSGGRHFMWREEQIEQFAYLIRSGEGKQWWVMNDYEFEDARDLTTAAAAAAADGNEDDGKNDSNNDDNRWTSSTWSNFIVRNLFLTLLLLAYSKLY